MTSQRLMYALFFLLHWETRKTSFPLRSIIASGDIRTKLANRGTPGATYRLFLPTTLAIY